MPACSRPARLWLSVLAVAAGLSAPAAANAAGDDPAPCGTDELTVDAVVAAVDVRHVDDPDFPYAIETWATLDVRDVVFGELTLPTVRVWAPGGYISPSDYLVAETQLYPRLGESGLVCLRSDDGALAALHKEASSAPAYFASEAVGVDVMRGIEIEALLDEHDDVLGAVTGPVFDAVQATRTDKGYSFVGTPYEYSQMPITYRVNPNTADVVGEDGAVVLGADVWEDDPATWVDLRFGGSTSIRRVDPEDGVRAVFWSFPPDGRKCEPFAARAFRAPHATDIEFNDHCRWTHSTSNGFDVQSVAIHEFGHLLGLGHTTVLGNIMCQRTDATGEAYDCEGSDGQRWLGPGDKAGVRVLYPNDDYRASVTPGSRVEVTRGQGSAEVEVIFKNEGRTPWNAFRKVSYHTDDPRLRCSIFDGSGTSLVPPVVGQPFQQWPSCHAPVTSLPPLYSNDSITEQGELVRFKFRFNAPVDASGKYDEDFALFLDRAVPMAGSTQTFTVEVTPGTSRVTLHASP